MQREKLISSDAPIRNREGLRVCFQRRAPGSVQRARRAPPPEPAPRSAQRPFRSHPQRELARRKLRPQRWRPSTAVFSSYGDSPFVARVAGLRSILAEADYSRGTIQFKKERQAWIRIEERSATLAMQSSVAHASRRRRLRANAPRLLRRSFPAGRVYADAMSLAPSCAGSLRAASIPGRFACLSCPRRRGRRRRCRSVRTGRCR